MRLKHSKKARGVQLGTPANLTQEVRQRKGGIRWATALILDQREQGLSYERIAGSECA